jgi:signal transduction histidine kinase/CheY-like chemotaxis protein/HPt (histidine-containing phosphotransfer) domain-containing protein
MALKNQTKSIISISFLVTICLIVFIAVNANRFMKNMSENNSRLYDAYRISELMKSFRSNITVMGNKERSYIVTGDAKFREEYKLKESETKIYLQLMGKYFVEKPEEGLFNRLKELSYQKIMQAKNLSHTMPGIPLMPEEEENQNAGLQTMDSINSTIDLINQSLGKTTRSLINNSITYVQSSRNWGLLEVGVGIFATLIAVIILFRDINVRNKLEAELRIAKKQADDNAMMKEQFMANMSHEIRTPMNAILGFTDLLHKTTLDPVQAEYLAAIKHSSSNLLNIINDILDFSKIEAGMLRIEKIPFSVDETIHTLRIMFEEKAREKGLGFEVMTDSRIPVTVFGDPMRLMQILVNLLNNAVKFTNHGSVRLHVQVEELQEAQVTLQFRIKDTGIGIPADKQADVFERFNQGNAETTRQYGGTGLGLSIVKSLVGLQKGTITFTSKEHSGAEFRVTIAYPVSQEAAKPLEETDAAQVKPFEKRYKVLLAEDNTLNQKLTATLLTGFGLACEVVEDGAAALVKLERNSFDLVLMDIQMPVLDGYHATQRIRQELKLDVPVIAMTAHSMEGELQKCMSFGMNDYISKPFKEEELYRVIRKYLGGENRINTDNHKPAPTGKLDLSDLHAMAKGNAQFIREMAEMFVGQNPGDVAELEKAIDNEDYEGISNIAHRMKTSVGFMGLKDLMQPLNGMEQLGKQKQGIAEIRETFIPVKTGCLYAVAELNSLLQNGFGPETND